MTTQKGFLVIADISGYTAFLSHSELEPAAEHLRSFMDLLIEHTRPPLTVSRLEGDAVISYALEGSFLQGQTLVEMVEETYVAFRKALEIFILNNTCECNACHYIPDLDLKFFVHYGSFLPQRLTSYTELVGRDVNLVHRLTKNTITDTTAIKAYVAYTEAAIEALAIEERRAYLIPHEESYDHVGRVMLYVQDMHALWHERQRQMSDQVTRDEMLFLVEHDFPVNPVLMWDYVTKPEYKAILAGTRQARVNNRQDGRVGLGTTYQCMSGDDVSVQTIVAWEPFQQYTCESTRSWGIRRRTTIQLTPTTDATKVSIVVSKGYGRASSVCLVHDLFFRLIEQRRLHRRLAQLTELVTGEIAAGKVIMPDFSPVQQLAYQ